MSETLRPIHSGTRFTILLDSRPATGPVVWKVVRQTPEKERLAAQLENELAVTQQLNNPIARRALRMDRYEGQPALVMAHVAGDTVADSYVKTRRSIRENLLLARSISRAVETLHEATLLHGDLTARNIIVRLTDGEPKITLIDFGFSRFLEPGGFRPSRPEGTLAYLAPEQTGRLNRPVDFRADLYAIGVVLFEVFTGRLPFEHDDPVELVHAQLAVAPPDPLQLNPELPSLLGKVVIRLLDKDPDSRYQTASGLAADLNRALTEWEELGEVSDFPLGENDLSARFDIPNKIYGRSAELQRLSNFWERIAAGSTELALVGGYPGVGKTSLVQKLRKRVGAAGGYFLQGSFQPMDSGTPLGGLREAFSDWVRQILAEPTPQLEAWKRQIREAVGDRGRLLTEVIPDLALVVGNLPALPEVGPSEARHRLRRTFIDLLRTIATAETPILLFLDDCHWADSDILNILELLLSRAKQPYLGIVCAIRDGDVPADHPFRLFLKTLGEQDVVIETLPLDNLSTEAVRAWVSEVVHASPENCRPLVEILYTKTQGNPFFVRQLLMTLHEEEALWFDAFERRWKWELADVRRLQITDNVVELMAGRVRQLPQQVQAILQVGAAIGEKFALDVLANTLNQPETQLTQALQQAIDEGMVAEYGQVESPREVRVFGFTHERIRQAVYSLIPENDRASLHLRIARIGVSLTPSERRETLPNEAIFQLTYQWNQGRALIQSREELRVLARFNLTAAQRSLSAGAYRSALKYAETGLHALAPFGWEAHYTLNNQMASIATRAAFLLGNTHLLMEMSGRIIRQAVNVVDKAEAYERRIQALIVEQRLQEAIEQGLRFLTQLGIKIPRHPSKFRVWWRVARLHFQMRNKKAADFLDLPHMTDPHHLAAMQTISVLLPAIVTSRPVLAPFLVAKLIELCVRHGNSTLSPIAYAQYGIMLSHLDQDTQSAVEYGKLSLELQQRYHAEELKAQVYFLYYSLLAPLRQSLKTCIDPLEKGYEAGLRAGDQANASFCLLQSFTFRFLSGEPLDELIERIEQVLRKLENHAPSNLKSYLRFGLQAMTNLNDVEASEEPWVFSGEILQEDELFAEVQVSHDDGIQLVVQFFKMIIAYLFEAQEDALKAADYIRSAVEARPAFPMPTAILDFFDCLVRLGAYPLATAFQRKELLLQVRQSLNRIRSITNDAPQHYLHLLYLIEAEEARVLGEDQTARQRYDQALALAQENQHQLESAMIYELTGKFYRNQQATFLAETYLKQAYRQYQRLGYNAKADFLEQRFPYYLRRTNSAEAFNESTTSTEGLHRIDLASITRASSAMAAEVVFTNLLEKMLRIVMENVGAQRGAFIDNRGGELKVVALGTIDQGIRTDTQIPLDTCDQLAAAIVNFVARTQEIVVLDNAARDPKFARDPYVQQQKPKSVMCYPIIYKGQFRGVMYLENNLAEGSFTEDRVEVLDILATQAGVSIENALLYESLDEKVRERTRELNRKNRQLERTLDRLQSTQSQLVQSEKMASLGQLTAGIAHEINNPINFISGNIGPLTRDIKEVKDLVEGIKNLQKGEDNAEKSQALLELHQELDGDFLFEEIEMLLNGIREGAERTRDIVLGLRNFSRLDEAEYKTVDLHEGLNSTLLLLRSKLKNRIKVHRKWGDLPPVSCRPGKINQVFMNLINNAAQAIEGEGEIWIATRRVGDHQVEVSIRDSGKGMSAEVKERVFEPFYTTKDVGEGTGLGLSISYGIMQQHNGEITVESTPGGGSTFTLRLPIEQDPEREQDAQQAKGSEQEQNLPQ